jgi:hypothetical protein
MNAYGVARIGNADAELIDMYENIVLLDSTFTQAKFADLMKRIGVDGLKRFLWELSDFE